MTHEGLKTNQKKTPKPLHKVRLTLQKPRTASRGTTLAQECIEHAQCTQINVKMAARTRRHQKNDKRAETAQLTYWHKLDGLENHADVSTAWMDMQSDGNNSKTAKNVSRKVRTSQGPKTHLESLKLKCPSVPKDRNALTLTGTTCTHRGTEIGRAHV